MNEIKFDFFKKLAKVRFAQKHRHAADFSGELETVFTNHFLSTLLKKFEENLNLKTSSGHTMTWSAYVRGYTNLVYSRPDPESASAAISSEISAPLTDTMCLINDDSVQSAHFD